MNAVVAKVDRSQSLKISEIFYSLQGESSTVGWPTVFVRLTGCPLRCTYCDTAYAFTGGQWLSFDDVVDTVTAYGCQRICVTGGEPLAQRRVLPLMTRFCDLGFAVSIETGGAHDISLIDPRVSRVMDLKTPGSGEVARNLMTNIDHLGKGDQVKFVICDRADFDWACQQIETFALTDRASVLMSPSYQQLPPSQLAKWVLEERPDARFQLQLHKQIWGEEQGR